MLDQFTTLENSVLEQFVSGDNMDAKRLRIQLAKLRIESREYTDTGFKTSFSLPANVPELSRDYNQNQANVYAEHPQSPAGACFLLHSENGLIKSLSGHVFVGTWPKDESEFRVLELNHSQIYPKVKQVK